MSALTKVNRRVAAVAAVVVFTTLVGASSAWAYWTTQATAQVTANSADLTVTTANFSSISKTFVNESLASTGSVTVTNSTAGSSPQQGKVTLVFSATGADAHRGNFSFAVWLSTAANPCTSAATPGATLASGTWGGTATYVTPNGGGYSIGESRTYCVRTTVATAAAAWPESGSLLFTPRVAATIALGNYTGAASATATQQTQHLFPVYNPPASPTTWNYIHRVFTTPAGNYCADLEGGSGPNGIGWPCKNSGTANQSYRFEAVSGKAGYFTIRSDVTAGIVLQQNVTGVPVTAVAAVSGQANQQWTLQTTPQNYSAGEVTRAFRQFVNASTGQCLTYASVNGTTAALNRLQMENCDGTASQRFLVVRAMFSGANGGPSTVSCSYASSNYTVRLDAATPNMRYELREGTTVVEGITADGSGKGSFSRARGSVSMGTTNFEIYEDSNAAGDAGTLVATGSFSKGILSNSCTASGMGQ